MQKGLKFRIYPNNEQKQLIDSTLGCARLIYNKGLEWRKATYLSGGKANYASSCRYLTALKRDPAYVFLNEVDSMALQQSLKDLDRAYRNFFAHRGKYPVYKKKHDSRQSYRTINQKGSIRVVGTRIHLPKLGDVKAKLSMPVDNSAINFATVEKTPTGKYYAVLNVDFIPEPKPGHGDIIGIDLGIPEFCTDNYGNTVENPRFLEHSAKKLRREQRRLSRKAPGSANREKQRLRVAKVQERASNQRKDFLQKESARLINENQVICLETLNVKGLLGKRKHKLSYQIQNASWSDFCRMLEYKAEWGSNIILRVPTTYPSSQLCSNCGYKNVKVKDLSIRKWKCPSCGSMHDRDRNAAINILNEGLRILAS